MNAWMIAARLGVEETIARYAHLGDLGDSVGLAALFLPEGKLETAHGVRAEGRQQISVYLAQLAAMDEDRPAFVRHHVSNIDIVDLAPDRASVRSYFLVLSDKGIDHHGRYRDVLVADSDGTWRFESRYVRLDVPPISPVFARTFS
jgi:hypothetical protein